MPAVRLRPLPRALLAAGVALAASATVSCGGGGGGSSAAADPLRITDRTVPGAALGHPYSAALAAAGGAPPYVWTLVPSGGSPPPGIALNTAGVLSGTAHAETDTFFTVQAKDVAGSVATARVDVSVRRLDVVAEPQGETGLLVPESDCVLTATADGDSVSFAIVADPSGGALVDPEPGLGTVTYRAGPETGRVVVRATRGAGTAFDFAFDVLADPFGRMTARFGTTDVWWPRFDQRDDPATPFTTDFDDSLAQVGLRAHLSIGPLGTRADRLAKTYVVRRIFRRLNHAFLNADDGDAAPGGLAISFCHLDPGDATHTTPPPMTRVLAYPGGYNVISFHYGFEQGIAAGTFGFPDPGNLNLDDFDGRSPNNAEGVHVQSVPPIVNGTFGNPVLAGSPVGAADTPALEAMLLDAPLSGARPDEIRRIGDDFADVLAIDAAHAVGHGIGLQHPTNPPATIMGLWPNPLTEAFVSSVAFGAGEIAILRAALPGPGR